MDSARTDMPNAARKIMCEIRSEDINDLARYINEQASLHLGSPQSIYGIQTYISSLFSNIHRSFIYLTKPSDISVQQEQEYSKTVETLKKQIQESIQNGKIWDVIKRKLSEASLQQNHKLPYPEAAHFNHNAQVPDPIGFKTYVHQPEPVLSSSYISDQKGLNVEGLVTNEIYSEIRSVLDKNSNIELDFSSKVQLWFHSPAGAIIMTCGLLVIFGTVIMIASIAESKEKQQRENGIRI